MNRGRLDNTHSCTPRWRHSDHEDVLAPSLFEKLLDLSTTIWLFGRAESVGFLRRGRVVGRSPDDSKLDVCAALNARAICHQL